MMPALLSLLLFASVVMLVAGLVAPVRNLEMASRSGARVGNVLSDSPLGPAIRMLAHLNRRESLEAYRERTERKLVLAGQPGGGFDAAEFLAAAELAGGTLFLLLVVLFLLAGSLGLVAIVFALLVGGFAFWVPHLWLNSAVLDRHVRLQRQFPFFLDLAVMTIGAGSTFGESVEIYCQDNPNDALAGELRVTLAEMSMGKTLREALENLHERIDVDEIKQTLSSIVQGQKLGTPLVETLREQADVMRFKRSQSAERMAEELKVRMQGPTMLMMISVFLLILGPAFIQMLRGGLF